MLFSIMLSLIGFVFGSWLFYIMFLGIGLSVFGFAMIYFKEVKELKSNLYLFFPSKSNEASGEEILDNIEEPLQIEKEDLPLKVCEMYRNGLGYGKIMKSLGLKHSNNVKRNIVKGLDFLLKFYHEHKGEKD